MTADIAAVSAAVDSAVPPALQARCEVAACRRPVFVVHRHVHLASGRHVGCVMRAAHLLPAQHGRPAPAAPSDHDDDAVAHELRDSFRDLSELPGDGAVFVRVNAAFLAGDLPVPARPGRIVAEVDGLAECDETVRDGLLRLKSLGCRVALGDFTGRPDQRRLLPFADFVKIDSRDLELEGRPLLRLGTSRGARLVAEFVDSRDALEQCRTAGIPLVQGRVFEPGAPRVRASVLSPAAGC